MGSDVASIRCTATADGEDYILNGTKYWVTNGGIADYLSVFATVDPASRHKGICAFFIETARLLTWKAAWDSDQGLDNTVSAATAKLYSSEAALEVVNEVLQIFGGYGYTEMFPIEKLLRDVRLFRIYEGTSEIQRLVLADYLLKKHPPALPPLEDIALHRQHGPLDPQSPASREKVWRCRICGHVHYGDAPP